MRGVTTLRFSIDFTQEQHDRFNTLAVMLGISRTQLIKRMIEVLSLPDRANGERLCVCRGPQKLSDVVGV